MRLGLDAHAGKDVRRTVVQEPVYIQWVLGQTNCRGPLEALVADVRRHVGTFDAKPFLKECAGKHAGAPCKRPVTRGTAYHSHSGLNVDLYWWCDTCDPYQTGAAATLLSVSTYADALNVVSRYHGAKSDYVKIIKIMAQAKGMPERVTTAALDAFFGP